MVSGFQNMLNFVLQPGPSSRRKMARVPYLGCQVRLSPGRAVLRQIYLSNCLICLAVSFLLNATKCRFWFGYIERNTRIYVSDSKLYTEKYNWTCAKRKFANNNSGLQNYSTLKSFSSSSSLLLTF